jgi:hypothetical protein
MAVGLRAWFVEDLFKNLDGLGPSFFLFYQSRFSNEPAKRQPTESLDRLLARIRTFHVDVYQVSAIGLYAIWFHPKEYPIFFAVKHGRRNLRAKNRPVVFGGKRHRMRRLLAEFTEQFRQLKRTFTASFNCLLKCFHPKPSVV